MAFTFLYYELLDNLYKIILNIHFNKHSVFYFVVKFLYLFKNHEIFLNLTFKFACCIFCSQ